MARSGVYVAKDTLGSKSVRKCITGRVRTWRFPTCQGEGRRILYPLMFDTNR